jgi:2-dehydro-3-deoxyphosphooctonate aldolase (KDO 8-P synthase)
MIDLKKLIKKQALFFIAGPCVIENEEVCNIVAKELIKISEKLSVQLIFKSSYEKANRMSHRSYRGPGLEKGLSILKKIKARFGLPVLTDVHEIGEVDRAAETADILQIPAFLCRQTDLIEKAARTGRWVNIKKGQFMAPEDMKHAAEKVSHMNNNKVFITERGSSFGYHNLVVDFRSFSIMKDLGLAVVFDATHSVQLPGAGSGCSSGERQFITPLSRCACAAGADGFFFEVHPQPDKALCDGSNSLNIKVLHNTIKELLEIKKTLLKIEKRA